MGGEAGGGLFALFPSQPFVFHPALASPFSGLAEGGLVVNRSLLAWLALMLCPSRAAHRGLFTAFYLHSWRRSLAGSFEPADLLSRQLRRGAVYPFTLADSDRAVKILDSVAREKKTDYEETPNLRKPPPGSEAWVEPKLTL